MARQRRHSFPLLLTVSVVLAALLSTPTAQAADPPGARGAGGGATARAAQASRALEAAQALFATKAHPKAALAAHGRDATLALRDLNRVRDSLTGERRAEADRLLARPTDPVDPANPEWVNYSTAEATPVCGATACVHYVTSTADAPDLTDSKDANGNAGANGIPDYVDLALATVESLYATYTGAGYNAPEPDGTLGGSAAIDIYLAEIGSKGLYGYCTSDKSFPADGPYNGWAYCVFDNDYAGFPAHTPTQNLQVTAAHEYFHAIQFSYDAFEDGWFMEATATWAEDELFDAVDDNVQYLPDGPQARPWVALDKFENQGVHQYGDWIFFRYLTERFPTAQGGIPTLVRQMWENADGSATGPDQTSIQAVNTVLRARSTSFAAQFARFADANRRPTRTYDEGAANSYPKAPLGKFDKKNGWYVTTLDHMTSATGRFTPSRTSKKLKIFVDLAGRATSPSAVVSVYKRNGSVQTSLIPLGTTGNGARTFPFARSTVAGVEVTLINASARFACWHGTVYSCQGTPRDENLTARVRGRALN